MPAKKAVTESRTKKFVPRKSRNHNQSVTEARKYADHLRRIDTKNDFSVMQSGPEIVICREARSGKYPAIKDIFNFVAIKIAEDGALEDVHFHFDGDSLSMYFTQFA